MSRSKSLLLASVAALSLVAVTAAPADAFWRGHRGGGAFAAAGIGAVAGLTLGALATQSAYAGYGYYGAGPYGYSTYGYAPAYTGYYDEGYAPVYSYGYGEAPSYGYAPAYASYDEDYGYAPGYSYSYSAPTYRYRPARSVAYDYQPSRQHVTAYSSGRMSDGQRAYRQSLAYRGDRQHLMGSGRTMRYNASAYNQRPARPMATNSQVSRQQHAMGHAGRNMGAAQSPQLTGSVSKAQRPMNAQRPAKAMKQDR
jgi:hypothetical protein